MVVTEERRLKQDQKAASTYGQSDHGPSHIIPTWDTIVRNVEYDSVASDYNFWHASVSYAKGLEDL